MISSQLTKILILASAVNGFVNHTASLGGLASRNLTSSKNETTHWHYGVNWDWEEYKECKVGKVCPDEKEKCDNGVSWKNLTEEFESAEKVDIIDMSSNVRLVQEPAGQIDIGKHKKEICYLAFVTHAGEDSGRKYENSGGNITASYEEYYGGGKTCHVWQIEDTCPWIAESDYIYNNGHNYSSADNYYNCESKIATRDPEIGDFAENCRHGPGWEGTLKTTIEEGRYMIDWSSLVQQPRCVTSVTLIDEKASKSKDFITTQSDVNFPVEYPKTTCDMKIIIKGHRKCFSFDTKVGCKKDETENSLRRTQDEKGSSMFFGILVVAAALVSVATVVAVVVLVMKKARLVRKNSKQHEELNDLYGTYFRGVEYNVAVDNNPRYNEDGDNDDAFVTDANIYYQI